METLVGLTGATGDALGDAKLQAMQALHRLVE
jgi:hypothetical protein